MGFEESLSYISPDAKVVLIVDHVYGGGSNFYRFDLEQKFLDSGQSLLLLYQSDGQYITRYTSLEGNTCDTVLGTLDNLKEALEPIAFTELFYNNCVTYTDPLEIPELLVYLKRKLSTAQLTLSVHDFFMACSSYALIDYTDRFCGIPDIDYCLKCIKKNVNPKHYSDKTRSLYTDVDIIKWRAAWGKCIEEATTIKCFSQSSRAVLLKAYPHINADKIHVEPHQVHHLANDHLDPSRQLDEQLHIGVVGNLGITHKGIDLIKEMVQIIRHNQLPVKITLIGALPEIASDEVLTITGEYQREQLSSIINESGINVFFISSICSETFSYVTHELMHFGVPIASFNIGAQSEAVSKYDKGVIIPEISASAALAHLKDFHIRIAQAQTETL